MADADADIDAVLQDLPDVTWSKEDDAGAAHIDLGASIDAISDVHTRLQQRLSDLSR